MVGLAASIGVPELSAQTVKPAWALTTEERIALRTDARLAKERVHGAARIRANVQVNGLMAADSFEGRTHPELFLPSEIFRTLMRQAYLGSESSSSQFRRAKTPTVANHGLPVDFWERLEKVSAAYIMDVRAADALGATLRRTRGRARSDVMADLQRIQFAACANQAAALSAARQEFGQEKLQRFLYDSVAIHMFHVADELPRVEDLRRAERGCR
ncbi:MAG TPA: hypothetical protein VNI54_13545 [Thermoanaerobaculia bacterium]|nr:hypothetical protein [Thermoanaerobaculia bacterium]